LAQPCSIPSWRTSPTEKRADSGKAFAASSAARNTANSLQALSVRLTSTSRSPASIFERFSAIEKNPEISEIRVIHRAKPCVKAVQVSDHRFSQEKSMGSYYNESYAEFLDSLKAAGVVIRNESEVRERLAESQRWRTAFMTLAANGRTLGIEFSVAGKSSDPRAVQRVLAEHAFPAEKEAAFIAQLTADR
jgi:hypothetical protein